MKYIFDVDGTLTPSRGRMNNEFANWFEHFATHNAVYLVTGSDREKTLEQIPEHIYNLCITVYQCSGNDVWQQGTNLRTSDFKLDDILFQDLINELENSKFHTRTGNHIDERPGLANFSVLGRNASLEDRFLYRQWDEHKNERQNICERLRKKWPNYNFQIAGETGIDITAKGSTKAQILTDFDPDDTLYFFGDKCKYGGNDFEIASDVVARLGDNKVFEVNDWEDTWSILKQLV